LSALGVYEVMNEDIGPGSQLYFEVANDCLTRQVLVEVDLKISHLQSSPVSPDLKFMGTQGMSFRDWKFCAVPMGKRCYFYVADTKSFLVSETRRVYIFPFHVPKVKGLYECVVSIIHGRVSIGLIDIVSSWDKIPKKLGYRQHISEVVAMQVNNEHIPGLNFYALEHVHADKINDLYKAVKSVIPTICLLITDGSTFAYSEGARYVYAIDKGHVMNFKVGRTQLKPYAAELMAWNGSEYVGVACSLDPLVVGPFVACRWSDTKHHVKGLRGVFNLYATQRNTGWVFHRECNHASAHDDVVRELRAIKKPMLTYDFQQFMADRKSFASASTTTMFRGSRGNYEIKLGVQLRVPIVIERLASRIYVRSCDLRIYTNNDILTEQDVQPWGDMNDVKYLVRRDGEWEVPIEVECGDFGMFVTPNEKVEDNGCTFGEISESNYYSE